jgi:hypothetical protein
MSRIASGEIDTEAKKEKLLEAYAEELLRKFPKWENLQVSVVAGAGFDLRPSGYGPQDDELPSPAKKNSSRQR